MSDQPKPTTGEWWTEQDVDGCWHIGTGNRGFAELDEATAKAIADAHTAALEAAIAAAQQPLVDLLQQIHDGDHGDISNSVANLIVERLAKVKEGK